MAKRPNGLRSARILKSTDTLTRPFGANADAPPNEALGLLLDADVVPAPELAPTPADPAFNPNQPADTTPPVVADTGNNLDDILGGPLPRANKSAAQVAADDLDDILSAAFAPEPDDPDEAVNVGDLFLEWDEEDALVEELAGSVDEDDDLIDAAVATPVVPETRTQLTVVPPAPLASTRDDDLSSLFDTDTDTDFDGEPIVLQPQPRHRRQQLQPQQQPSTVPQSDGMDHLDQVLKIGTARQTTFGKWRARLIWLALLGGLIYVGLLPYPFEVGGNFVVQPLDRSESRTRTDGEIITMSAAEGDWVKEGDILAVLSNWDEKRDVALNQADDAKLRADLATLTNGARPEEIKVVEQSLASAELQVSVAQKNLDLQNELLVSGTVSKKVVQDSENVYALAVAARDEAAAKLALVGSGAQKTEVDSLMAAISRNSEELKFSNLMLEYTNVRAPAAGQIVSSLSGVPVGAFLPKGGLFAELENNRVVIAEIEVPETSIDEVVIGADAELRLWSNPEDSLFGTVQSIAPRAEQRDFGWIIRVEVQVQNPAGKLAANMTGFGKISAAERPTWQAFSQAIVGFFKIELWSWVP